MIYNRSKKVHNDTPTRHTHPLNRLGDLVCLEKKSDPFLRELKEVYDKQNINPNVKQNRVRSHNQKTDLHQEHRSPKRKLQIRQRGSQGKKEIYASNKSSSSNRKSTEKNQPYVGKFQEEYYNLKEQKKERKMKVTLKDIKKHRKSIQESEQEYGKGYETKDSISQQSLGMLNSHQSQTLKNQPPSKEVTLKIKSECNEETQTSLEGRCVNHPLKKATHRLMDSLETFCEKCAVILVTQGHKMMQLGQERWDKMRFNNIREGRLSQLKDFLFELDKLEPIFSQSQAQLAYYRQNLKSKFMEEQAGLYAYYNNLRRDLEASEKQSLFKLKIYYDSAIEEIEKIQNYLSEDQLEAAKIKEDILPNVNSILQETNVTEEFFRQIIAQHQSTLLGIQKRLNVCMNVQQVYYYCDYQMNNHFTNDFKNKIAPGFCQQEYCSMTERREATPEEKLQIFRLSFGKDVRN